MLCSPLYQKSENRKTIFLIMKIKPTIIKHKLVNKLQLYALFLLLSGLTVYIGLIIGGELLAIAVFFSVIIFYFVNPYIASQFILRMYNAQAIPYSSAPVLYDMLDQLSSRAGLSFSPKLYYVPSSAINSFTVGQSSRSIIAISDGILQQLNYEEISGILGHEISHIKNEDIRVMIFADISGRLIKIFSFMGQLLILISLPFILLGHMTINWLPLFIIIFAPFISDLIQLALSRVREYEADLGSALLLGDARPLISALNKISYYEHRYIKSLITPFYKIPEPSLLRTHPRTEERINRLRDIHETLKNESIEFYPEVLSGNRPHHHIETKHRNPRFHRNGFWY